jgi:SAM-dependent methyltransferase
VKVHPLAAGFDEAAGAYERARPEYPAEAVDWLWARLGLGEGCRVVDLGAGTGKLTRMLVARGAQVLAVEPIEGMRAQLARAVPEADAVPGTAEAIPAGDGSADAVTAAQAFHWFDPEPTLAEMHRVLRPGGGVGLIWNMRDSTHPLQAALDELLEPLRGQNYPRSKHWRDVFSTHELFTPLEDETFPFVQRLDEDGLVERVSSISFVAKLPDDERSRVLQYARELAPREETFDFPYQTRVYVSSRR